MHSPTPMPTQTSARILSTPSCTSPALSYISPPSSTMKPTPPAPIEETNQILPEKDLNLKDLFEAKSVTDTTATVYRSELPPKT